MMLTAAALLCGALAGWGAKLVLDAVVVSRTPLAVQLDALTQPGTSLAELVADGDHDRNVVDDLLNSLVALLDLLGIRPTEQRRCELRLLDSSWPAHVRTKLVVRDDRHGPGLDRWLLDRAPWPEWPWTPSSRSPSPRSLPPSGSSGPT